MSESKYVRLDFTHTEINECINKVKNGMVLTKDEYDKLCKEIGLDNISTFDGDYNSLKNLPVLPTKLSDLENDIISEKIYSEEELVELIKAQVGEQVEKELFEEVQAKVEEMDALLENKVDMEEGKSLIADEEIARLAEVKNYDDAEVKAALLQKVDNEVIEVIQGEIHAIENNMKNKIDKEEGFSLLSDEEIERLAKLENYDDAEVRELFLDDIPYEVDFNGKHYVFGCGHPMFVEMVDEQLVITMGIDPEGIKQIVVPKSLISKTIVVGGFGTKHVNKGRHLAGTYVHVKNAELLAVHGGNFFEGSVGKATVIVENSKVKEIIGGGDAGKQIDGRGAFKNVVFETEVILNDVTGCTLCYGGGGGHCTVAKAKVVANNCQIQYIFPCGANGMTIDCELHINNGVYNYVSQVNRGIVMDSKVFLNSGVVRNFYFGGETEDTSVDGVLHNGYIVLNGGTINNFKFGTSNGQELTEANGLIRNTTVVNGDLISLEKLDDRPLDAKAGDFTFDAKLNKPIFFNGVNWVDSEGFIVG